MASIINATTTNGLSTSADNSGELQLATNNGTTAVTVTTAQNVGIGTTSPTIYGSYRTLEVRSAGGGLLQLGTGASTAAYLFQDGTNSGFNNISNGVMTFGTNNSERMRIDSSGRVLVGTTSNIDLMPVQSVSTTRGQFLCRFSTASAGKFWSIGPDSSSSNLTVYNQGGAGVFILDGGTSWNGTSDERLKNIVGEISDAVDKTCSLRAVKFTWKNNESGKTCVGLIAQDVQKVLPEAVNENTEGYLGVAYTETIPLLVAAIKELKTELDTVKATVEAQAAEIAALKGAQ
jgi:hypothetical protein